MAYITTKKQMHRLRDVGGRGLPGKVGRQDVEPDSLASQLPDGCSPVFGLCYVASTFVLKLQASGL